ncbi:MAG: hypothetical protein EA424_00950 [Planctomycetaceae bacterium]|nr:MAG: hypothetical protein EA424_00950 [Planctomycetaceae bacterium]
MSVAYRLSHDNYLVFAVTGTRLSKLSDVRRAIAASRRPIHELADEIGVEPRLLSDFCAGDAELPPVALDRLLETLGLRLM